MADRNDLPIFDAERVPPGSQVENTKTNSQLTFFRIPKPSVKTRHDIVSKSYTKTLARRYRDLRLTGLRLSPEAFSSTYEIECRYPDCVWEDRLSKADLETFVCAEAGENGKDAGSGGQVSETDDVSVNVSQKSSAANPEAEENSKWIAQVTLRGPITAEDFYFLPPESGFPKRPSHQDTTHEHFEMWQVLSLYVLPNQRGRGIAQTLCLTALEWLQQRQRSQTTILARTMIKCKNVTSIALFKKIGFHDAGRCTLAEALRANGERVPEGNEEDVFRKRTGQILLWRCP